MDDIVEVRHRLRTGHRIVGYQRQIGAQTWYSPDGLWWRGATIPHDLKDAGTPWKDRNNQWLYEWDVVEWKTMPGQWTFERIDGKWQLTSNGLVAEVTPNGRLYKREGFRFPSLK